MPLKVERPLTDVPQAYELKTHYLNTLRWLADIFVRPCDWMLLMTLKVAHNRLLKVYYLTPDLTYYVKLERFYYLCFYRQFWFPKLPWILLILFFHTLHYLGKLCNENENSYIIFAHIEVQSGKRVISGAVGTEGLRWSVNCSLSKSLRIPPWSWMGLVVNGPFPFPPIHNEQKFCETKTIQ